MTRRRKALPPKPIIVRRLSQEDLLRLETMRLRWEKMDLATQLGTLKLDETKRMAEQALRGLSAKLERDVVERQRAKEAFEAFRLDVEMRYEIDLTVVSYDDETGQIVEPEQGG